MRITLRSILQVRRRFYSAVDPFQVKTDQEVLVHLGFTHAEIPSSAILIERASKFPVAEYPSSTVASEMNRDG
jgi:hypothetical protein